MCEEQKTPSPAELALQVPELKPCPFCGGAARMCGIPDHQGFVVGYVVKCDECYAQARGFRGSRAYIEYAPKCFASTDKLLAARAWNCRPGEGTFACDQCGVAVPHRHETYEKSKILAVLI